MNYPFDEKLDEIKKSGIKKAEELKQQGHHFLAKIIAPKCVNAGDHVQLACVKIDLDWKVEKKLQMVDLANEIIENIFLLGLHDPALPLVFQSIINGKELFVYPIGEFFFLYGQFERKFSLKSGGMVRKKMLDLINGNSKYLKSYKGQKKDQKNKTTPEPLPFAIRNILGHGNNTNEYNDSELSLAISILRDWVNDSKEVHTVSSINQTPESN